MLVGSVMFAMTLPLMAETKTVGDYTYNYIDNGDGTVTLSHYDENGNWIDSCISPAPVGDFVIPAEIDGKSVVAIRGDIFPDYRLTSITVPASVANWAVGAFYQAGNLTNITVAADNPFYKDVDGILYTKDGKMLVACPRAKGGNIIVEPGTEYIGDSAFCYNNNLTSISLPVGLKGIGYAAFWEIRTLDTITIPASVEQIEESAFGNCSSLAAVTFEGIESDIDIAATAFAATPYDAAKPFSLIVNDYGSLVGFHGIAPENVVISNYLGGADLTGIGYAALSAWYYDTSCMTNVVVPEGVTGIGSYAFADDEALESVTLPTSLQRISYGAFSYCTSLRTVLIPSGVTYIDDVFYGCTNLTVTAPSTLRDTFSVPEEDGCRIEYYDVPQHTVTFNANGGTVDGAATTAWTVYEGRRLDSVDEYYDYYDLPAPVRTDYSFVGWFTEAEGGDAVTAETVVTGDMTLYAHWEEIVYTYNYIDNGDGTVTLTYISPSPVGEFTIPDEIDGKRVVAIGNNCLYSNWMLTSVTIPASVARIGDYAFRYCSGLKVVTFLGNESGIDIADTAFMGTPYDASKPFSLIVENGKVLGYHGTCPATLSASDFPVGVTSIGPSAFSGVTSLTNIEIPTGVANIGDSAFYYSALTNVVLPASVMTIGYYAFGYYSDYGIIIHAPSSLRDSFYIPGGGTVDYYEVPRYTVTFDANGGTVNGSSVAAWTIWEGWTLEGGLGLLGNANGLTWPENDGYASSGWFTAAEGGDEVTADTVVTGDMTLYAHWVESPFSFSGNAPWVPEGDGVWRSGKVSVGQCSSADMFVVGPAKVSFKWKKTSSTNYYDDRLRFAVDADYVGEAWSGVEDWQDFSYTINDGSGHTLRWVYAKEYYFGPAASTCGWIKDVVVTPLVGCTVTLDANGGVIEGGDSYAASAFEGEPLELWNLPRPSRDGYVFLGWIDPDGNIVYNFIVPGDVTLTAFWLEESPWLCDYVYNDDVCSDGLMIWGLEDDSAIENGVLTIPNTLTGIVRNGKVVQLPVVAIGDWELVGLSGIATVNLPSKLEYIGEGAFSGCKDLANVNGLTDGVKVGRLAFAGTPYYDTLPFGLDIEDNCVVGFHGPCNEIVRIDAGVTNIAWYAFSFGSYSYEVYDAVVDDWYERSEVEKLQSVVVPDSVESISEWSFEGCTNLTSVAIANPEVLIDGSAFNGCYNLGSIDVEKVGYTLVGWDLFRECNPTRWVYDPATGTHRFEEYEAPVIPTGVVMRVESIEPLIYGMPTDGLKTNYVWDVVAQAPVEVVSVATNYLEGVWATPAWAVNKYTVTFNANGGGGTMAAQAFVYDEEQLLNECTFTLPGYEFRGWSLSADSDDIAYFDGENVVNLTDAADGSVTLYAVWEYVPVPVPVLPPTQAESPANEQGRMMLWTPVAFGGATAGGDAIFTGEVAEMYNGFVQNAKGKVVGTIQVKAAKAKNATSKITVTIQLAAEKKKQTVNGILDTNTGKFEGKDGAGRALSLLLGENSLSGTYGPYFIDGAQNKFTTKRTASKALGTTALAKWRGSWSVAWPDEDGWSGASLSVGAKGKVKVSCVLANGTKVSASSQLLVGEGGVCAVPVVITKKVQLAFNVWFSDAGVEVVGLDGAVAGSVNSLKSGVVFRIDAGALSSLLGRTVLPYLPDGASVAQDGNKWVVASGAKAGKVVYLKGTTEVDADKLGENPSGLKITFTAKAGTFKGSFKAYADVNGAPKATTVNISGVLVDGVGYGAATIKKVGGVPITVE